jgi:probable F420-dependent oxidoreductase
MRFGVGLPTCREGTAYPVPYVRPQDFATLAARAEELGFYSLWANDHLTTPHVIQATQADAPNFYEPLITYASLTHVTRRLRLVLSVLVLPHRDVVVVAKQLATLDVLTGGRVMLGLGIGAYREEFEAVRPELRGANRGALLEEGIRALQLLFTQRRASLQGTHIRFAEIELAPKPMQRPFPIYVSAHEAAGFRRAGRLGDGLIVAGLARDRIGEARATMTAAAVQAGRDPARLSVHFQIWLSFGRDRAEAEAKLRRSQHFRRTVARDPERSEEKALAQYRAGNLFGHPDDVIQQLREFERLGVAHVGLVFLGSTRDELLADMELFAERVMPAFPEAEPAGGERS